MNIKYKIIHKANISDSHREIFAQLLNNQEKVKGDLRLKADRCKIICIALKNNEAVAIGGIKEKTSSDFYSEKANLAEESKYFEWELGYIYTKPDFTRKGIASSVISHLLNEYGNGNLMASTEISANPGMVKILKINGFKCYGNSWKSGIHPNYLGLFLKYT